MTSDCQTEAGAVIDYVHTMIMSFCINAWESETVRVGENNWRTCQPEWIDSLQACRLSRDVREEHDLPGLDSAGPVQDARQAVLLPLPQ